MSKPDRFERAYDKMPKWFDPDSTKQEVIHLLRREHRAVVRILEKKRIPENRYSSKIAIGWNQALDNMIATLKRRAQ